MRGRVYDDTYYCVKNPVRVRPVQLYQNVERAHGDLPSRRRARPLLRPGAYAGTGCALLWPVPHVLHTAKATFQYCPHPVEPTTGCQKKWLPCQRHTFHMWTFRWSSCKSGMY